MATMAPFSFECFYLQSPKGIVLLALYAAFLFLVLAAIELAQLLLCEVCVLPLCVLCACVCVCVFIVAFVCFYWSLA